MKAKQLLFPIIALVVGALIGGLGGYAYTGRNMARTLLLLKTIELSKSADLAYEAYTNEAPTVGVWALTQHLELIDEFDEIGYPHEWELEFGALMTHARLARLHDMLDQPEKKAEHVREAIALAEASGRKAFENLTTEDSLWEILGKADERNLP